VALAEFFRHWHHATGEDWRNVGTFFLPGDDGAPAPVTRVRDFLSPVSDTIADTLIRVLPKEVTTEIGVDGDAWAVMNRGYGSRHSRAPRKSLIATRT
jgi:hypothetical protein